MGTGAVVAGRRTFDIAGGWAGDHHDGVPIFVLSRHAPDSETARSALVSYVTDVETAMARAKEAAGEKNVLVHGARTAQLALAAGVLDELQIHLIPVLLGQGRRLFDHLGPEHTEIELIRITDAPEVTQPPSRQRSVTRAARHSYVSLTHCRRRSQRRRGVRRRWPVSGMRQVLAL